MADWDFRLLCKMWPLLIPQFLPSWWWWCFCSISLSLAAHPPFPLPDTRGHFLSRFFSSDWPVITPPFSEMKLPSGIWNKTGLVNPESDKVTVQMPHGKSERAREKSRPWTWDCTMLASLDAWQDVERNFNPPTFLTAITSFVHSIACY